MRVSVDNPEVNLLAGPDLCVGERVRCGGQVVEDPVEHVRAGADMLSSVARVQVSPSPGHVGMSCCPSLAEEEDTHEGHTDEQDDNWPNDHRISEWCIGIHDSSVNRVQTQRRRHRQPPCGRRRCRCSGIDPRSDARRQTTARRRQSTNVVEVQDIAGRIA